MTNGACTAAPSTPAFPPLGTLSALAAPVARAARLPRGFTEKSANVNGVKINYKIGGQGPVVVLLHGYAQTSHMWRPLMPCSRRRTP